MTAMQSSLHGRPPEIETKWNVLSLGAGVQSSTLALMAAKGEVGPMPDFAIFADTQSEPQHVYDWLDWLETQLPYPVIRATAGSIERDSVEIIPRVKTEGQYTKSLIPAFMLAKDNSIGLLGRTCTGDYKIKPILKTVRSRCGITRGQKTLSVTQWIGISYDEVIRMKPSREKWSQHRWPLIEKEMRRGDCLEWMKANGYPEPPRSSCVFCPFHSDSEWRRLKNNHPVEFNRAMEFKAELQRTKGLTDKMKSVPYLHRSCVPLGSIDFSSEEDRGQVSMFGNECEGMCGV